MDLKENNHPAEIFNLYSVFSDKYSNKTPGKNLSGRHVTMKNYGGWTLGRVDRNFVLKTNCVKIMKKFYTVKLAGIW